MTTHFFTAIGRTMQIFMITDLPEGFNALMLDAEEHGHTFLSKMKAEWNSGKNRFSQQREALFSLKEEGGQIIGIGGLNIDPYANNPAVGRLRHVYIFAKYQRSGYGKLLVQKIIEQAHLSFELLRLRTRNPYAIKLYKSLGFEEDTSINDPTHVTLQMKLQRP